MSRASLLAGLAGGLGVLAAWEGLAASESALRAGALRSLAPLRRADAGGLPPSAGERRRLALLAAGVCLLGGWLAAGPLLALPLALGAPGAALAVVRRRRRAWRAELAREAPAAARALADALGAGHSVRGALGETGRALGGRAGGELRRLGRGLALGGETEEELERLRARAGSEPWETLTAAILLQREAGGDLAGLLRGIAAAQEEAARLERDARAATAQARFTGLLICGLPLGAAGLAVLLAPDAVLGILRAPASAVLGTLALGLQAGSLWAIRRLARLPA